MSEIDFVTEHHPTRSKNASGNVSKDSSRLSCIQSEILSTWDAIMEEYNKERQEMENYLKKRDGVEGKITCEQCMYNALIFLYIIC